MTRYSVQPRDINNKYKNLEIFVIAMDFYYFLKTWANMLIKLNKNLSSKYSEKRLDHPRQQLKLLPEKAIQKVA